MADDLKRLMRIAKRMSGALPVKPWAKSGTPKRALCLPFDASDRKAVAAAVESLAEAVRLARPRRYFRIPVAACWGLQCQTGPVRVLQTFDPVLREMVARADVWIG